MRRPSGKDCRPPPILGGLKANELWGWLEFVEQRLSEGDERDVSPKMVELEDCGKQFTLQIPLPFLGEIRLDELLRMSAIGFFPITTDTNRANQRDFPKARIDKAKKGLRLIKRRKSYVQSSQTLSRQNRQASLS